MAGQRPSWFIRVANGLVAALIRSGLPMGRMALLTVSGRRSRLPRSTPVTLTPHGKGWSLGSPFGETDWVRNLRFAGMGTITRGRRTTQVLCTELSPRLAAPLLMASLAGVGPIARRALRRYFAVPFDASLTEWIEEAASHPTFILEPV